MKHITRIVILFLSLFIIMPDSQAQTPKDYAPQWKKVEDYIKKGLPASALQEVKAIYALAKKDKQEAQLVKSLLYMTNLQAENRENNEALSVQEVEKEISGNTGVTRALLQNMLAGMYWGYFQQNRWKFYSRTNTVNFVKEDMATWTADDFHNQISWLYLASLQEESLLQQTRLEPYAAIVTKGNVRHLRPTLYDLLAHEALQYFDNSERDITRPAYAFEIDQASAFDPAADFIHRRFPTKDSSSLQHKALLLWQKLVAFHLNDAKPDALIDADMGRLQFVKNRSTHPDKDKLYYLAVNHIAHQYNSTPAASIAWYQLANYHLEKGSSYKPYGDSTYRMDLLKAKEICEKILQQKDSSEGKTLAYNLLQRIQRQSIHFSVEKVNVPQLPFRASVQYKNVTTLYLRLVAADEQLKTSLERANQQKYWQLLLAAGKTKKEWTQSLPPSDDLQQHSTEIKIDGLPSGTYILIAGTDKNFANEKTILGARQFYVSNIAYVNRENDFFVLDRQSGQPLSNASVQVWEQRYDYNQSKYIKDKKEKYQTDKNGFFKKKDHTTSENRYNRPAYALEITHKGDRLLLDEWTYDYHYRDLDDDDEKATTQIFYFTDRSLYRPGQTVYFKGITITSKSGEQATPLTGYKTQVYLQDANGQEIDSLSVTTNEYGTFSGRFQLPASGLNGRFSILSRHEYENGEAGFYVEEYKRPKFYAEYEPVKETYQVNDTIRVTGSAKAYAGNNIDGALVKYRVVRQPRFVYGWFFRRGYMPPSTPLEIAHGETTTDANGQFTLEFPAIPDNTLDKKWDPVFDYQVFADVTDINGETRSASVTVSAGYKSLLLQTNLPASMPADSIKHLPVSTTNMNGQFIPVPVNIKITRLREENRLIRERYWDRPDKFVMNKNEYIKLFPYDEYDNELDPSSWEKASVAASLTDSTRENGKLPTHLKNLPAGMYLVELSARDDKGREVTQKAYLRLYDGKNILLNNTTYLLTENSQPLEPGETTTVRVASAAKDVYLVQQTEKEKAGKPSITYQYHKLNQENKSFSFTASEQDRGGYGASWVFVKHNRVYQHTETIRVPWSNKELNISYATYRDKTLPGSEEKWKLKISGNKNEKVASELLASMYDASLDQFYDHRWYTPGIWPEYQSWRIWKSEENFSAAEVNQMRQQNEKYKTLVKNYDQLIFGNNRGLYIESLGSSNIQVRGMASRTAPAMEAEYKMSAKIKAEDLMGSIPGVVVTDSMTTQSFEKAENSPKQPGVQIRTNFNETAFFFPELKTDAEGNIAFSFTMPEALTRWKFQALAHTKELAFGYSTQEIVTQKQLMVQPNPTRFLRQGDTIVFSAKIANLSESALSGKAVLQLFNAATNQPADILFNNKNATQPFEAAAGQSAAVSYTLVIPANYMDALVWRIVAEAGAYSDGEENMLPVLTNRMLVTESLPVHIKGNGEKSFRFDKLLQSGKSSTLQHQSLTLEYTSNPVWYAVQALPYLMEYPYECAEQTWNRYYANSLASFIAHSSPRIRQVFEQWKNSDTTALMSKLQQNQELKSILLEETPWLLQGKSEAEQKRNIALLFDLVKMSGQLNSSLEKLKQLQSANGGFVWFAGGPDDRYMTQYIITGIGHLQKLNGIAAGQSEKLSAILSTAIPYLDSKIKEDYDELLKNKTDLTKYVPGYTTVQYLYMRSFFSGYKLPAEMKTAYDYFTRRTAATWTQQNKYLQGMIALALHRGNDRNTPAAILKSLKETSVYHEELGRYWKDASRGWWWYEAPIERQALLIEAFQEAGGNAATADELRTWLLKNKQTNRWESTKATAEACYALLLQGSNWLSHDPVVTLTAGNQVFSSAQAKQEAGTGYFKEVIAGEKVKAEMGKITLNVKENTASAPGWGAVYWQYFEELDKITMAATPLQLSKKLFIEKNTSKGPALNPITDQQQISVGDKIKVRIELRADRDMEYVHMKDMRAAALEPVNVLSGYRWQGGLGYYESTKDASTNFFFSYLRKGTYVFEYTLFATHAGQFSNGVTTIQCMYAPEFTAHSEGIRISVK